MNHTPGCCCFSPTCTDLDCEGRELAIELQTENGGHEVAREVSVRTYVQASPARLATLAMAGRVLVAAAGISYWAAVVLFHFRPFH